MADQTNTPEEKPAPKAKDDKTINDLLEEYAQDVEDKDIDDFLKGVDADDDAFELDSADEDDDAAAASPALTRPERKSGSLLTGLMMLVAFGAAGAGTYMYLNRDAGMTDMMAGIEGPAATHSPMAAPANDETMPVADLPALDEATANAAPTAFDALDENGQTTDILAVDELVAPDMAPLEAPNEATDLATTLPMPTPIEDDIADVAEVVDAWATGDEDALPERKVEELKAKAPVLKKDEKPAPVKIVKKESVKAKAKLKDAPKAETKKASAKPTKLLPYDEALPPPYLAIQAQKQGKPAPVAPSAMQAAPEQSLADADVAKMVSNGGGKIELPVAAPDMPAAPALAPTPVADAAPVMPAAPVAPVMPMASGATTIPAPAPEPMPVLAINGGRSMPEGNASIAPVRMPSAAPLQPEAPLSPIAAPEEMPAPVSEVVVAPVVVAPAPVADTHDAKQILANAIALEKAGNTAAALDAYRHALEVDAVYADGKSIDRGMVYDRIGALSAAQ